MIAICEIQKLQCELYQVDSTSKPMPREPKWRFLFDTC